MVSKFNLENFKPKLIIKKKFNSSLLNFNCPNCNGELELMVFLGVFNNKFCYVSRCEKDNEYFFTIAECNNNDKSGLLTEQTQSYKNFGK